MTVIAWVLAAAGVSGVPGTATAQAVLATPEQALREIFPEAAAVDHQQRALSRELKRRLEAQLGRRIAEDSVDVRLVRDASRRLVGYAVVTDEVGKYRPITFMVGVSPALVVRDVTVLVYRESRGGEVRRERFLAQYRGKRAGDPIDLDRDIINVSGATISVRALNAGVKRVLAELTALYPPEKAP